MFKSLLGVIIASTVLSACSGDGSQGALASAYEVGEAAAESSVEGGEADRQVLEGVKFESIEYRSVQATDPVPLLSTTCGVTYQLAAKGWGIVPGMTYPCGDAKARDQALADAPTRLRSTLDIQASSYESRLQALRSPASALTDVGPALVSARSFGVDFNLNACFNTVAGRLAETAAAEEALQCETFLDPGPALDDFQRDLTRAADRAKGIVTTPVVTTPPMLAPDVAARCGASAGSATLAIPGAVSGILSSTGVAYLIRLGSSQGILIDLTSSSFDAMLQIYDGSCMNLISRDDDGGGGTNSRLRFTGPGDYVVVAGAFGSGRGPYTLTISSDESGRVLTEQARNDAAALVDWVSKASPDDVAAAWRGSSPADLQLACINRARFESRDSARSSVRGRALATCTAALKEAIEAHRAMAAGNR